MTQKHREHVLYSIGLGFTSACNMGCPFCYSQEKRNLTSECNYEDWTAFFLRNGSNIGCLNYGTGENTTSEAWYCMIEFINMKFPQIRQAVTTNGTLCDVVANDSSKRASIIKCINEVDVSLDFASPEKHNYYRGNDCAYKWALGTLEFCAKNNIVPTIVTLGVDETLTLENMESIFQIAADYNAMVRINIYRPINIHSPFKPVSFQTMLNFFDWVNEKHKIVSISDPLFCSIFTSNIIKEDPSGRSSLRITQDGKIYPSTYLLMDKFELGNIKDFNFFEDCSENHILEQFRNLALPIACQDCILAERCKGGTIDRRYLWYKTLSEKDPYCPKRYDMQVNLREYSLHDYGFSSVHDGYLPTLFFKPKK